MKLLLARHGQTDWNVKGKVQGITDIELNETGIKQAKETREKLLNENIDVIISSPLKRAQKTAEIIGSGRNIPIIIDEAIIERKYGKFEGKISKELDVYGMWNYKLNNKYESVESIQEEFNRIENFLNKIKEEYKDKTVLLVTHGGVAIPIRAKLEGIPEGVEDLTCFAITNCEIKEYEI